MLLFLVGVAGLRFWGEGSNEATDQPHSCLKSFPQPQAQPLPLFVGSQRAASVRLDPPPRPGSNCRYHALGNPPSSEEYPGLYVPLNEFREEIAWLARNGYQGVTLDEVERAWYRGGTLPAKPIVITFDNGYPAQVRFAPSVLDRYGWPAVLFEITVEHLTAPYIKPIIAKGWEVDSHSATHPDLTTMSGTELRYPSRLPTVPAAPATHVPSNNFCYPFEPLQQLYYCSRAPPPATPPPSPRMPATHAARTPMN